MRRSALLALLFLAAPLAAQTAVSIRSFAPEERVPGTIQAWEAKVRKEGWPQWVLLPGNTADWTGEMDKVLGSDPALLEYHLGQWSIPTVEPLGKELCAREHWGPETRWALVDKEGAVLDTGTALPSAHDLSDLLERRGIQGPIQVLTAFLGSHPDRVDALNALLSRRVALARALMKPFLEPVKPQKDDGGPPRSPEPPGLAKPLPDDEDARIWGPVARLVALGLRNRCLNDMSGAWSFQLGYAGAAHSPTMQAIASRCLPDLESELQVKPDDYNVWGLWVRMQEVAGGRPIRPLLDSITPLPMPGTRVMPDDYSLGTYISGAARRQRWNDIVDLAQPWWDSRKETHWKVVMLDQDGKTMDSLKSDWDRLIAPLVEAYLRLGQGYDADRVVREAMAWRPSAGLPQWASALGRRCGDEQSASQWARMAVPKQPAP